MSIFFYKMFLLLHRVGFIKGFVLKVSNNIDKLNIGNNDALNNVPFKGTITPFINNNGDYFQKNIYVTAPSPKIDHNNFVYSNYNSKQLLNAYLNPSYIKKLVDSNPKINEMFKEKGISVSINPENISEIINSHLTTTTAYALQIANFMNLSPYDKQILEQACIFHDFGKVLIPREILNKPTNLTAQEKEIVDMHSQLGYELLSQTGMNKRVLDLVKNHHDYNPQKDDKLAQILSIADIYSALREERSYKKPLNDNITFSILESKAKAGEINEEVLTALKSVLSSQKVA